MEKNIGISLETRIIFGKEFNYCIMSKNKQKRLLRKKDNYYFFYIRREHNT